MDDISLFEKKKRKKNFDTNNKNILLRYRNGISQ